MDDIIIFDDFLSIEQQDEIEKQIIVNTLFRWKASYGGVFKLPTKEELGDSRPLALDAPKDGKIKIKDNKFWNQSRPGLMVAECFEAYNSWTWWSQNSNFQDTILQPLYKAINNKFEIQRIKINYNAREIREHEGSCYVPHVDIEDGGGLTGIYYIDDSDGDTVIFNEYGNNPIRNNEEISVKQVIKNKRGRLVVFDQNSLHAGCPPIYSDKRLVINFNIKQL
tara:strand:- start:459 stop:1127 length:669 start_codon:yes stop_codon:yes gene_type:complete